MTPARSIALAAAGSAALHVLLLMGLAVLALLEARFPATLPEAPAPEPIEVTVAMPEILIPPTLPEDEVPPVPEDDPDREKARRTYMRTTQNEREPSAPTDAPFESDRNTTAAAEAAAASSPDTPALPSMEGMDLPAIELIDREFTDGRFADESTRGDEGPEDPSPASNPANLTPPTPPTPATPVATTPEPTEPIPPSDQDGSLDERPESPEEGSALLARAEPPRARERLEAFPADPSTTPVEVPQPPDTPDTDTSEVPVPEVREPTEIALEEAGALRRQQDRLLDQLTPPDPRPPSSPSRPSEPRPKPGNPMESERDVFQPHTRRRHFEGGINRRGQSAVDAAETPVGRYGKVVNQAISRQWHLYRVANADFLTYGNMKVEFQITRDGRIENLRILEKAPNAVMTDFTLNAILDARIPAIPDDVLPILEGGRFNMSYQIIIY